MWVTLVTLTLATAAPSSEVRLDDVLILSDGKFPRPPCTGCNDLDISDTRRTPAHKARALILSGHSGSNGYLGLSAEELARTVARLAVPEPDFIIMDTCYGARAELLRALVSHGVRPRLTIAAAEPVAFQGLSYGDLFEHPSISITAVLGKVHIRGFDARTGQNGLTYVTSVALDQMGRIVSEARDLRTDACHTIDLLVRKHPNLVAVSLDGVLGALLVALPPDRFKNCYGELTGAAAPPQGVIVALVVLVLALVLPFLRSSSCLNSR